MARFSTLRKFDFNHFHLVRLGTFRKSLIVKTAIMMAAAKISRSDLPDQVATRVSMVITDPSFSGIMGKVPQFCPSV
ncbi:hypothetical protein D3C86_1958550 [compost metagenome]